MSTFETGPTAESTATPVARGGERQGPTPAKKSALGRAFQWIAVRNTYIPGVSTVTGIGKAILGLGMGLEGLAQSFIGLVGVGISIFVPSYVPRGGGMSRFHKRSLSLVKGGVARFSIGFKEILRGAVSAIPVVGNLLVYGADKATRQSDSHIIADPLCRFGESDFSKNPLEQKISAIARKQIQQPQPQDPLGKE